MSGALNVIHTGINRQVSQTGRTYITAVITQSLQSSVFAFASLPLSLSLSFFLCVCVSNVSLIWSDREMAGIVVEQVSQYSFTR